LPPAEGLRLRCCADAGILSGQAFTHPPMNKISPCLWFDDQAEDAAKLYRSLFEDSETYYITRYGKAGFEIHGQPEGKVMTVEFQIAGQSFTALNGGPFFKANPSISFLVCCTSREEVDRLWKAFSDGGKALMELGTYPFSGHYGWIQDKFGISWQVMLMGDRPFTQKIVPTLMYVGAMAGKAEEAMGRYVSIFPNSKIDGVMRYGAGEAPDAEGTVKHAGFTLEGQAFAAMDSAHKHEFSFNEGISLVVRCKDQAEIDRLWDALGEGGDPEAQQCGWLKDKYGVSWQIVPENMDDMLQHGSKEANERAMAAMLQMHKLDIAALEAAAKG
jgi:predicted 3-demethylubiquinone-9 3-methyltransferase (glyoxalase superfamily)